MKIENFQFIYSKTLYYGWKILISMEVQEQNMNFMMKKTITIFCIQHETTVANKEKYLKTKKKSQLNVDDLC